MINFLVETFSLGIKNILLHKLRSLLTTLGIIIGVISVIVMVGIGEGAEREALRRLDQLGAKNILVRSVRPPEANDASSRSQRVLDYGLKRLDQKRLEESLLRTGTDQGGGLVRVVAVRDTEQPVFHNGAKIPAANAIATTPDVFEVINLRTARGSTFTWVDYNGEPPNPVCVLGATAAQQIFPFEDPLGQTIQVGSSRSSLILTVVGVLEPTGLRQGSDTVGITNRDLDLDVYFPLSVAQKTFGDTIVRQQAGSMERKQIELSELWLQARRTEDVEALASVAENIVMSTRGGRIDAEVKAPIQILRNAEKTAKEFNQLMGGIATMSLIVGGIGIMNIMLASVTERTREIGIRRALGAKQRHITLQFLIETTVVSLLGGLIGVGVGVGAVYAIPWLQTRMGWDVTLMAVAPWSVVASFTASGLIGIGFGLYPAVIAARMNPIEALRHE